MCFMSLQGNNSSGFCTLQKRIKCSSESNKDKLLCKCFCSCCIFISWECFLLALCFCHNTHMLLQEFVLLPPLTRLLWLVIKEKHSTYRGLTGPDRLHTHTERERLQVIAEGSEHNMYITAAANATTNSTSTLSATYYYIILWLLLQQLLQAITTWPDLLLQSPGAEMSCWYPVNPLWE